MKNEIIKIQACHSCVCCFSSNFSHSLFILKDLQTVQKYQFTAVLKFKTQFLHQKKNLPKGLRKTLVLTSTRKHKPMESININTIN